MRLNRRMDWKTLILELQESGLTQYEIAQACDTGQSHISGLARGARRSPGWELGERIRKLHAERCGGGVLPAAGRLAPEEGACSA